MLPRSVVVCIKHAAVASGDALTLTANERGIDFRELEWELNDWDRFAIEAAVQLRETGGDRKVVAVTAGSEQADDSLRRCLATGADRAVRIDIAEDDPIAADALGVARILAPVVREAAPDLVLCGAQSQDLRHGSTGSALAALLGLPICAVVRAIAWQPTDQRATVERELEGGSLEVLEIDTPAVLTVQSGINQPRYATLRAIKLASQSEIEVLRSPDDVRAGGRIRRVFRPEVQSAAKRLEGPPAAVAERVKQIIEERLRA